MMNFKKKAVFTAILALLALTMALSAGCQGAGPQQGGPTGNNSNLPLDMAKAGLTNDAAGSGGISVSGQGSVTLQPDVAYVSLGVETQNADAGRAREENNVKMDKVLGAVKGFGIADDDITTTGFSINSYTDDKGQKIVGYRVYNNVRVRVKNLNKLGAVITAATDSGANMAGGIQFSVLDETAAYNEALKEAMAKARARAELMAKALGVKVGRVLTINESSSYNGPTYPAAEGIMDNAKGIDVPVSGGTMDVTASVNVVYEIVK